MGSKMTTRVKDGAKKCGKCGVWKPFKDFSPHSRGAAGLQSRCKECTNIHLKTYFAERSPRPVSINVKICPHCNQLLPSTAFTCSKRRQDGLSYYCRQCFAARKHGLTALNIQSMRQSQNNCCAICCRKFDKLPCIDHDHATGDVRGLLCSRCNSALGLFVDNVESLENAIQYLLKE